MPPDPPNPPRSRSLWGWALGVVGLGAAIIGLGSLITGPGAFSRDVVNALARHDVPAIGEAITTRERGLLGLTEPQLEALIEQAVLPYVPKGQVTQYREESTRFLGLGLWGGRLRTSRSIVLSARIVGAQTSERIVLTMRERNGIRTISLIDGLMMPRFEAHFAPALPAKPAPPEADNTLARLAGWVAVRPTFTKVGVRRLPWRGVAEGVSPRLYQELLIADALRIGYTPAEIRNEILRLTGESLAVTGRERTWDQVLEGEPEAGDSDPAGRS